MGIFEQYQARAKRHANEDSGRRKLAERVEPLVAKLLPGRNYFNGQEFLELAKYILDESEGVREVAVRSGKFSIGSIEIVRYRHADSEWLSALELARMAGLSRRHMSRLLQNAGISFRMFGNQKFYSLVEIKVMRILVKNESGHDAA